MTLKVGCVRACVREEVINGGSLSSAQQQMGRGSGLVGWVTRIMNLPVVLFNTKKKRKRKTQTAKKQAGFYRNSRHEQTGEELILYWSVPHLSKQSFITSRGKCDQKAVLFYFMGANNELTTSWCSLSSGVSCKTCLFIFPWILTMQQQHTVSGHGSCDSLSPPN